MVFYVTKLQYGVRLVRYRTMQLLNMNSHPFTEPVYGREKRYLLNGIIFDKLLPSLFKLNHLT